MKAISRMFIMTGEYYRRLKYIPKSYYKGIEKSIFHKVMMVKNMKSSHILVYPYIIPKVKILKIIKLLKNSKYIIYSD